ncbi:MAG: hypothetical protein ACD_52C00204G0002 [uncultured bacterium]|uniref:Uncharacterized protein n=1 Tax=Candidatus Woesebacteria bacterium RIFCSPHIGHO2_12_FULL_41_24 TaxID=1802510 RepID=A0A1F8ASC3_9BACT|nr:MAG: hypothetical protein ACD_52C00204G0002 [uncultured bacterium]OGM12921.1 MAG: hypothetical protein A2W15_00985 [Candidatus Woesebacteria bacterium RBG_16_41_13]OGM34961.1 MAG: hypothetical protein A3D84_06035 [Candidatus Woesebacteria bacterium RIFCSPHIGHO2_02_FULL_42_20]OGM54652.1 MAG: hypothetical protein A3E44_02395 [Candidatus Woesebacteria bacterium RIFCSPHIGHO2_12_FULL_41_24]
MQSMTIKTDSATSGKIWKRTALLLFVIILLTQTFEISITPKLSFLRNSLLTKQQVVTAQTPIGSGSIDTATLTKAVLPDEGVALPISWGDLGKQMLADGVIDEAKFRALFEGGLTNTEEQMLSGNSNQPIVMNQQNSRYLLDLLWAFGLANKNAILENGEMTDKQYGGAGNFASTGGWSLAKGAGMDHYSKHAYITLTKQEQTLVDKVSSGIYRPCCGNSTHFPDCNHGMAMLGLLELLAKNGAGEQEMYNVALKVNSFWFPQTYIDLATYFKEQGKDWNQVDAKTVLGSEYSSAQGYQQTRQQIQSLPKPQQGGGGCGA